MSVRSYSKVWLHLIWNTYNHQKSLNNELLRKNIARHITENSCDKGIFMKICFVNQDHVHGLVELPTNIAIEEMMKLIKGESSHWINTQVDFKFSWGKGYGVFSVSQSNMMKVYNYIKNQSEHHKVKSFSDELKEFLDAYKIEEK